MVQDYVGYRAGAACAIVRGDAVVLFATLPDDDLRDLVWRTCEGPVRPTAILRTLLRRGFDAVGDVAFAVRESGGGFAVTLWGDVHAIVRRAGDRPGQAGSEAVVHSGIGADTWAEILTAPTDVVTLSVGALTSAPAARDLFPLGEGVVRADVVQLPGIGAELGGDTDADVDAGEPLAQLDNLEATVPVSALDLLGPAPRTASTAATAASVAHLTPAELADITTGAVLLPLPDLAGATGAAGPAKVEVTDQTLIGSELAGYLPDSALVEHAPGVAAGPGPVEPEPAPRPPAQLRLPSGEVVPLDRPALIGRAPFHEGPPTTLPPRLVAVPSPNGDISRSHVRIEVVEGHALVTDLNSTNGVMLLQHYLPPVRLHPAVPTPIDVGTRVDLGDGVLMLLEPGT